MITRRLMALVVTLGITLSVGAEAAPPSGSPPQKRAPAADAGTPPPQATKKAKPRRVIIFGTTIVGDVLTPTIEKTVPWQRPAAFRSNVAPLTHDFTIELLTPLDRNEILREMDGHEH